MSMPSEIAAGTIIRQTRIHECAGLQYGCVTRYFRTLTRTVERHMAVAKSTEIQSASSKSFEDAIQQGIARAEKTLRNVSGAWIKSQQVVIEQGRITEYRVLMKVTFVLQD